MPPNISPTKAAIDSQLAGDARKFGSHSYSWLTAAAGAVLSLAIVFAATNSYLRSIPGLEALPAIQLHMEFNSYAFLLIFLPASVALYSLFRTSRVSNWVIAASSLILYSTVGLIYLVPLIFTCVTDYLVGMYLASSQRERIRKFIFVGSVCVQLGLLCLFKYYGWLSSGFDELTASLGLGLAATYIALPLPPGISFYTFHTISYTADIYARKFKPQGSLVDYIAFVSLYPQLIAGPIARASETLPQIARLRPRITALVVDEALWLIFWGLFKKMCIADNFGALVSQSLQALHSPNPPAGIGWIFSVSFAFQIYADFSAYTDIARGIAKLFGIELPRNFLTPYLAKSPSDFWRRWHISLSRWIRDYLYIPLGGDRRGRLVTLRNLAITMFLGGLWHGAGIGFILWGVYHGAILIAYRLLPIDVLLSQRAGRLGEALSIALMFILACVGWIFFRASTPDLLPLFKSLSRFPEVTSIASHSALLWGMLIFGCPLVLTELYGFRHGVEFVDLYRRWPWWGRGILYVAMFYAIVFFARREASDFIYFQF